MASLKKNICNVLKRPKYLQYGIKPFKYVFSWATQSHVFKVNVHDRARTRFNFHKVVPQPRREYLQWCPLDLDPFRFVSAVNRSSTLCFDREKTGDG